MPQIWLSCEELGGLLGETPEAIHYACQRTGRRVRLDADGSIRLLLSNEMAREYVAMCAAEVIRRQTLADRTRAASFDPAPTVASWRPVTPLRPAPSYDSPLPRKGEMRHRPSFRRVIGRAA